LKFAGIAASPGIGLGDVVRVEPEEFVVREARIAADEVERELERFGAAIGAAKLDLTRIRDGIAAELGPQEAGIYDAHLLMLEDPEVRKSVDEGVRRDRRSAAAAYRDVMSATAARLERLEDEYLRERRADVLDVERRVLRHLLGRPERGLADRPGPVLLVAHDLGPSDVALLDPARVRGLVTEVGGRTSHGAIVARGRGIPAVVAVRGALQGVRNGDAGVVDGYAGVLETNPDPQTIELYQARCAALDQEGEALGRLAFEPARTLDGRAMELGANLELPTDVEQALTSGADGVGLFRTEFFYLGRPELPTEQEQFEAYRGVAERLAPRPVIFRTMDLGGDKVASYLGTTHEANPFLGWRGIRFALHRPELFRAQIRAIYRASAHGNVRLMFPMVSNEEELLGALALCREAEVALAKEGVPHDPNLEIGVMIETPSAVWLADAFSRHVQFLSIGTNDLTQYTLAIDRDNARVTHLYEPLNPAILRSIDHTVRAGHAAGRWVGVCGEMAGDPRHAVLLLGLGVDELSMSAFDLPRVKAAIRSVRADTAEALAKEALACSTAAAVKELLRTRIDTMLPSFLVAKRSPL
jgi:phosphotransferase system enzyme I (PtsI)